MKNLILIILLIMMIPLIKGKDIPKIGNNTIYLDNFTLEQKISQMFIIKASHRNLLLADKAGGIYVSGLKTKEDYKRIIEKFQNKSKIKLLVTTDLEGYWNPFPFVEFPNLDEIETAKKAYELGMEHGKILNELGFNMNFAPVAELKDEVWKHRAFAGSKEEISEKINSYVKGLQEQGVMATLKHYPGGSLNVKDPHLHLVKANITREQLEVFNSALQEVKAVMIGHAIVFGAVDSKGKPSTVSEEVIGGLREKFSGLVISDDINMRGLRNKYIFNEKQMIIDLIKAGNDVIIDTSLFSLFPRYKFDKRINYIKEAVELGRIDEEKIDGAVTRILKSKGYDVV